eukprot:12382770-Alexandrium_andersonii.AAC.1
MGRMYGTGGSGTLGPWSSLFGSTTSSPGTPSICVPSGVGRVMRTDVGERSCPWLSIIPFVGSGLSVLW